VSSAGLRSIDYKGGIDEFLKTVKNSRLSPKVKKIKKQILLKLNS